MAAKTLKRGFFITFEGPEGCGKSTHSKLLYEYLKAQGYTCVYTREPGGTKLGEAIRKVLLDSQGLDISDLSELLLFEAARAQIVKEVIGPALKDRAIVISDRFGDATFAYQGYGGGLALKTIAAIDRFATGGCVPGITILLDIETSLGLARATEKKADRMEEKALSYHSRVRRGYLKIAAKYPRRIKVIRVKGDIGKMQASVRQEVERVLRKYKRPG